VDRPWPMNEMEGADGWVAQFFKGVATVCAKLFNAVEVGSTVTSGRHDEAEEKVAGPRVFRTEGYSTSTPPPYQCLHLAALEKQC
jgi:hypothetical protein